MISQIKGKISKLTEEFVTIELNGLHYELMIPSGLYDELKLTRDNDSEVLLHTLNYIEAGDRKSYHYPRLIGFTRLIDKEFFQLFTTVSGMGFKKGLKSLTLPIKEIATAIETKDPATLVRLPGIGRRLADKVIAELNGKMARFALSKGEVPLTTVRREMADTFDEAVEILVQLQYSQAEAQRLVDKALKANPKIGATEELISFIFSQEAAGQKAVKR
jgi:Holliday junction DNA helicase RuvA